MKLWLPIILPLMIPVHLPAQSIFSAADPERFQIISSDVEHFWQAYNLAYPWFFPEIFDSLYLRRATNGLRTYQTFQLNSIDTFCRKIREEWDYFESVKPATLEIGRHEPEIRAAAFALKYLYPEARFPDIYFVMGDRVDGDLVFNQGIIINAGQFGPHPAPPTRARRTIAADYSIELMPAYIARKLVLYQLNYPEPLTLLGQCIREGVAEVITELITGRQLHLELNELVAGREAEIWRNFLADKEAQSSGDWLTSSSSYRPSTSLGIWVGYQIARSYYDQSENKRAAIAAMMQIQDFNCFLLESGALKKQ